MGKIITIEFIREFFKNNGCELVSQEYCKNSQPLNYKCKCGRNCTTTWARFKNSPRCKQCYLEDPNRKKVRGQYNQQYAKECFEKYSCELLDVYINNYTPMKYRCSCGNISKIRLFALIKGQKCSNCGYQRGNQHYAWNPDREEAKFIKNLRHRYTFLVRSVYSAIGKNKTFKSAEILGYSPKELRKHLELFPNWENIKKGKWHIDHIFPIKAFLEYKIFDAKKINCLENLRPLPAKYNLSKNAKYSKHDFDTWLKNHGWM